MLNLKSYFSVNLSMIDNYENNYLKMHKDTEGPHLKTKAIIHLMIGAGVNRIFSKEDLKEFFCRVNLMFGELKMGENYFLMDETLFQIHFFEEHHDVTIQDIINHIGIDLTNKCSFSERTEWIKFAQGHWKGAQLCGLFFHSPFNTYEIKEDAKNPDKENLICNANFNSAPSFLFSAEQIKTNEELANVLINNIPETSFENLHRKFGNEISKKLKDIYDFQNKKRPPYIRENLPSEVVNRIYKHLEEYLDLNSELDKKIADQLILLIWLYANDYIYDMGGLLEIDNYYEDKYDLDLFDNQLFQNVYEEYELTKFEKELKILN